MRTLNNKNRIDGFNGIVENALRMKAKKTPWHLRFAGKMKTAAAVVGIGLFMAPMESAQAQTQDVLTYSRISGVHVHCWNEVIYYVSIGFHVFDTSSDYVVWSNFPSFPFGRREDGFNDSAYYLAQYRELNLPFGDRLLFFFKNGADSSDWIQLQLYISPFPSEGTGEGRYAAAYVEHSATYGGTAWHSYYVDIYCPQLILDVRSE